MCFHCVIHPEEVAVALTAAAPLLLPFSTRLKSYWRSFRNRNKRNDELRCPICRTPLLAGAEKEQLSTYVDDILDQVPYWHTPYTCPNLSCVAHNTPVRWLDGGERHGRLPGEPFYPIDEVFAGNDAPYGSFMRKMNVEFHEKKSELDIPLGRLSVTITKKVKANRDGYAYWLYPQIRFWFQKDPQSDIRSLVMFWPRTWYYLFTNFYRLKKNYHAQSVPSSQQRLLREMFPKWYATSDFAYRSYFLIVSKLHPELYAQIREERR